MTILTLLRTELRRLTSTKLSILAFVALMAVPLLYGGMYLWGNLDPYGKFSSVPAGIVVADAGTTTDGTTVNRGRTAADALVKDGSFAWQELSAAAAKRELANGGVDFVITFPAGFSKDLASVGTTDPERARIALTTNDANSYLASTIAKSVATEVRDSVAEQVGETAANRFLVSLSTVRSSLADASDSAATLASGAASAGAGAKTAATGAAALASGADTTASGAASLSTGARSTASGAESLASGLGTLARSSAALPTAATQVADGDAALATALRSAASSTATSAALSQRLAADGLSQAQIRSALALLEPGGQALSKAATQASTLASGARRVAAGASSVSTAARSAASGAAKVSSAAGQVASGASSVASATQRLSTSSGTLASGTASLAAGTAKVASGADELHSGLAKGVTRIPATTAAGRATQAAAIADPVAVATTDTSAAGSYGAGLAPLFLSLAAWIGSYALFLILRPLSRRAITAVRQPIRIALAGWLTPALLGVAQMVALFLIAVGPLGIRIADPLSTIAVLALTAGTFAAILLLLNAALGSVGQFLGLVLMLVQLVTAGGTFPWQTLPGPLAAIHHALPMSYAVDALRQVMYGGDAALAWGDVGVLAIWLVAALALTAAITARMTRHRTLRDLQPSLLGG